MSNQPHDPVRHRKVFYVPGYDPFPPRRYRELYRTEAAEQAAISGYDIAIKAGLSSGGFGWQVASLTDGQPCMVEIEVLVWSDIVQDSRTRSVFATYVDLLRTVWIYLSTGAFFRLMLLRKGPVIAALYPVLALAFQACAAFLLGWATYRVVTLMADQLGAQVLSLLGGALGVGITVLALLWFRENDGKFFAQYLMHDFAFSAGARGAYPPVLENRLSHFGRKLDMALGSDVDEVLVVGHSSGVHLAVSLLADVLRHRPPSQQAPSLALLSLGHVVPMMSFLPKANRLRRDLRYLSQSRGITWVDVTAPGDGCCFALCDPVAVSGQKSETQQGPLIFSAAFTQSLSPNRWKALRWRFFRLHFQYLCAFDRPRDYDYFQITAGPMRLKDRYANRAPSRSLIEKPVSRFTSADI